MKNFRLNVECFNELRNVKYLLKITFVLALVSPPALGAVARCGHRYIHKLIRILTSLSMDVSTQGAQDFFFLFKFPSA